MSQPKRQTRSKTKSAAVVAEKKRKLNKKGDSVSILINIKNGRVTHVENLPHGYDYKPIYQLQHQHHPLDGEDEDEQFCYKSGSAENDCSCAGCFAFDMVAMPKDALIRSVVRFMKELAVIHNRPYSVVIAGFCFYADLQEPAEWMPKRAEELSQAIYPEALEEFIDVTFSKEKISKFIIDNLSSTKKDHRLSEKCLITRLGIH